MNILNTGTALLWVHQHSQPLSAT